MRSLPAVLAATMLAALPAGAPPALAQTGATVAPPAAAGAPTRLQPGQVQVKTLMDLDVYSTDGTEIGEVEDLVIDPASGRILAAVIEIEGRLGFTEKHVAVPLERLRLEDGRRRATLSMTRDEVRGLPGFEYRD